MTEESRPNKFASFFRVFEPKNCNRNSLKSVNRNLHRAQRTMRVYEVLHTVALVFLVGFPMIYWGWRGVLPLVHGWPNGSIPHPNDMNFHSLLTKRIVVCKHPLSPSYVSSMCFFPSVVLFVFLLRLSVQQRGISAVKISPAMEADQILQNCG